MIACKFDGGLFIDGILFKLAQDQFWFVRPDGSLDTWLLAHRDGYDVQQFAVDKYPQNRSRDFR